MKKLLSILSAITLTSLTSTSIIACGDETPGKTDLNTTTLKSSLVFTNTMTGQAAYTELRTKIKDLSSGIYKDVAEIKSDDTLLIAIWPISDDTTSDLSRLSSVDVKIKITEDNKAFTAMDWTNLSDTKVAIRPALNTTSLESNLAFTKTMTGQAAYTELRTKIKDLSSGIYKDVVEIKSDDTLLIAIWDNDKPNAMIMDNTTSNLSLVSTVQVKVKIIENNKAFTKMDWTVLTLTVTS